jgi:hypothetical protein
MGVNALTSKGTLKKGGKVVQTVRREIKGRETMTITFKGVNARGQTINNVMMFEKRLELPHVLA